MVVNYVDFYPSDIMNHYNCLNCSYLTSTCSNVVQCVDYGDYREVPDLQEECVKNKSFYLIV